MEKSQRRLELQAILEGFTQKYVSKEDRTRHVYYNPPSGFQMEYPCIVYEEGRPTNYHADNLRYFHFTRWKVTTLTLAPQVAELPHCSLNGAPFKMDGLVHHVFELYW